MRLLARDLSRLGPDLRITRGMYDREYHDALGFDTVENRIRKPRDNGTANLPVDTREDIWETFDGVECSVDGRKKILAKAITLPAVPPVTTGQVPSDLPTVDNR